MRVLLDTQALIWFATGDRRLPSRVQQLVISRDNELLLSVVTAWEIVIKSMLGKLVLDRPAAGYLAYYIDHLSLIPLPIALEHAFAITQLPPLHADPFDRLLIAQARYERIPIITGDKAIRAYDVQVIW